MVAAYPRRGTGDTRANVFVTLMGLAIGIMIFGGLFSFHAIFLVPVPCSGSFCPTYTPDQLAYISLVRNLGWVSMALMDLAVALSVAIAFILGVMKGDIPDATRRNAGIFATVFLAVWLVAGSFLFTALLGTIRFLG